MDRETMHMRDMLVYREVASLVASKILEGSEDSEENAGVFHVRR